MQGAILLDRDGTLVDVVRDEELGVVNVAFHPSQLRLLPGVVEGLGLLRDAGHVFGIATNQPGPAKGQISIEAVARTNLALVAMLMEQGIEVRAVRVCPHHERGGPGGDPLLVGPCECRKPKPGLLVGLMADLGVGCEITWMVGDSAADIEAGGRAGVRTGLVFAQNRCELCPLRAGPAALGVVPDVAGGTLLDVARAILGRA
ncbi:MAG: HAD-IIIA family hydrolase [Myxococcales bacterium]